MENCSAITNITQHFKVFIGISSGGTVTFINELYNGSISDQEIIVRSGLKSKAPVSRLVNAEVNSGKV